MGKSQKGTQYFFDPQKSILCWKNIKRPPRPKFSSQITFFTWLVQHCYNNFDQKYYNIEHFYQNYYTIEDFDQNYSMLVKSILCCSNFWPKLLQRYFEAVLIKLEQFDQHWNNFNQNSYNSVQSSN